MAMVGSDVGECGQGQRWPQVGVAKDKCRHVHT